MTGEKETTRSRTHPRSSLVFVHGKCRDGTAVDRSNGTDSIAVRTQANKHLASLWHHFLNEHLSVVSFAVGTVIVASIIRGK